MNLWKRATFYTLRKWKKSLLLFSIIFSVSTLILSGLAISDAQAEQTAELKETTGVSFTISRNSATGDWSTGTNGSYSTQAFISDDMIEKIASVNGIKNYNATYESCGLYQKSNGSQLEKMNPTGWSDVDSQLYEIGCINSAYNSLFLSNAFSLTDGRHISKEDKNGVLLNKEYAEKNGLRIGDKIKNANLSGEQNVIVEYEIIGLFDIQADKTDEKNNYNAASYYDYSQYAFLSMPAYKEATIHYPDGPSAGYTDADFFLEDPEQLEKIIQNVQSISSINWDNFLIQVNDEVYERVADSVSDMNSLVFTLVVLLLTVSVLIIVLLLSMWIRNRKHEIGIMLAVGITKPTILLQHILEILLIAAAAFPSSYPVARNIAGNIGKLFGKPATNIHVTQQHFVIVTVLGTLLIILAVITACIPIIKYRPKEILAQME